MRKNVFSIQKIFRVKMKRAVKSILCVHRDGGESRNLVSNPLCDVVGRVEFDCPTRDSDYVMLSHQYAKPSR